MVTSTIGLSDLWITDEGVTLEDDAQIIAQMRAEVLRPLLLLQSEGQQIGPAVEFAAAQLDVSRSTAWRLLGLLRENDGRASALLPNRSGPKRGSYRLSEQVEDLIDRVLRDRYLVLERPSFRRIVGEIRAECSAKGFQPPSRQTIKARLDAMDQRDVLRKRKGAKAASKYSRRGQGA